MAGLSANAERLNEIGTTSPEALGLAMLQADPNAWRLDRDQQLAAVSEALVDGAATARHFRSRFGTSKPTEIANQLGLTIETTDSDPLVGSIWRFAEYRARPPGILLYRHGIALLERELCGATAARLIGQVAPKDVFIAHELYHHAEASRPQPPTSRRHRVVLFRLGRWHWRTGIAALSEIAAGSFAQELFDLPCHPKILDAVALDAICKHRFIIGQDAVNG
jgi:hypothetical protein